MLKLFFGNHTYQMAELEPKPHLGWFEDGHFYWKNSLQVQEVSTTKMRDLLNGAGTLTKLGAQLLNVLRETERDEMFADAPWATLEDEADHARNLLKIRIWLTEIEQQRKQENKA
jgi:hypothetical protein